MRKLFFFRSSIPEPTNNEKLIQEAVSHDKTSAKKPREGSGLRRSLSFSSAIFSGGGIGDMTSRFLWDDPSRSPSSSGTAQSSGVPFDRRSLTPERQFKGKRHERTSTRKAYGIEKPDSSSSSKGFHNSTGNSCCGSPHALKLDSSCSMDVSNKVLDLYIDGEQQQQDRNLRRKNSSKANSSSIGVGGGWRPPRVQSRGPGSPTDHSRERLRSQSFRDLRGSQPNLVARELKRNEFENASPQKLAKNVVERLSQVFPQKPMAKSHDVDPDSPTTVEDIFEHFMDPFPASNLSDKPFRATSGQNKEEIPDFHRGSIVPGDALVGLSFGRTDEDIDVELHRKVIDAHETVMFVSEELEQVNFLRDSEIGISELYQKLKSSVEERKSLAMEVLTQIQSRISERENARESFRVAKVEMESQTWILEKEKNELQLGLEKELDRRSSDWSFKIEKYQSEERRLRERVRELAEQNVTLQREVSSMNEMEIESRSRMVHLESQLKDLTRRVEEIRSENQDLQKNLSELQDKYRGAEEDRTSIKRNYVEKEKENKELHKTVARLQRTCMEHERTIDSLRQGLSDETIRNGPSSSDVHRWQVEQLRSTGVEQNLRKEVESYRLEIESLRRENIKLLDRLQSNRIDGWSSSFKLDQELQDRVYCLQDQGLSMFNECIDLCGKLLRYNRNVQEVDSNGCDDYSMVESSMKVQSFKRGINQFKRSLQTISSVLHEKSKVSALESHSACTEGSRSGKLKDHTVEDEIELKLWEETLLTSLLREKLFSKQMEIEQLQTELATAVRGHDILRSEAQSALDSLSSASHKMKDLEIQMLRKDDKINLVQSDLQECKKELATKNMVLPKISEERDLLWEEVKQYREKNMLLNSEVNFLKQKIETLDEDIHVKEGQITILKDSLRSNKTLFDSIYTSSP